MKKLYIFAAATMLLVSCANEEELVKQEPVNGNLHPMEITAGTPGGDSRTSFTDGGVKWSENDQLSVFIGGSTNYQFTIEGEDVGKNEAKFTGNGTVGTLSNNVAYYPYDANATLSYTDNKYSLTATFPTVQTYAADGSFGPNSLPMMAVTETTATTDRFEFKTLGGWLQLYVKGEATITKVVMKAKGHQIAGQFTATAAYGTTPSITMAEDASESIALKVDPVVTLSNDKATLFTFAVAPFTFDAGEVSFDLYDNQGKFMPNAYVVPKGGTVIANAYYTLSAGNPIQYVGQDPEAKIGEVAYATLEEAIESVDTEAEITMGADATIEETIVIPEGKEITINLNSKTITGTVDRNSGVLTNEGTLTIKNGTIQSTVENGGAAIKNSGILSVENATITGAPSKGDGTASYAVNTSGDGSQLTVTSTSISGRGTIGATNGAKVTIESGNFNTPEVAWGHAVYASGEGTEVTINGGTFTEGYKYADNLWGMYQIYAGDGSKVTVNNGDFSQQWDCANGYDLATAGTGVIEIKGGIFADNPASQNGKNYVAKGYEATENADGTYTVSKSVVAKIGDVEYGSLAEAIDAATEGNEVTITLIRDVTIPQDTQVSIPENKNIKLVLNGKKVIGGNYNLLTNDEGYIIANNGTLTIVGDENSVMSANGLESGYGMIINKGTLTLNGGTYTGSVWNEKSGDYPGYTIRNHGNMTINDGTKIHGTFGCVSNPGGTLTVNGGTFTNSDLPGATHYLMCVWGNGSVVLKGGNFTFYSTDANAMGSPIFGAWDGGAFTIEGGTFDANQGAMGYGSAAVTIKGGTFKNAAKNVFQNSSGISVLLAEGYCITENSEDESWKVVEAQASINGVGYPTIEAALQVVADKGVIDVVEGEFDLVSQLNQVSGYPNKTITIKGAGIEKTNLKGATNSNNQQPGNYAHDLNVKFEELTFTTTNNGYNGGFGHAASVEFTNCKIVGQFYAHSGAPHKFTGCTIDPLTGYLYTYSSNCDFNNCTFTASEGKALQVYADASSGEATVNIKNCTFTAAKHAETWDKKPVTGIDINTNGTFKLTVNISSTTASGFPKGLNSGSDLWNVKNLNGDITVNVDGELVWPFVSVSTVEGLKDALTTAGAAQAGTTTIKLAGDLDLSTTTWTPITVDGYHGADIITIDGGGATITGLTAPLFAGGFAGGSGIVIKNLTIDNSQIVSSNDKGSGAFVECSDSQEKVYLENCHLINSTVTGSRTGGLIGWTSGYNNENDGPVKLYVTMKDCSVINCTITGSSVGGLNGHAGANEWTYTTIENCKVTNCTLTSTDDGDWRVGVAVGTANVGEVTITNLTESENTLTQTNKTAPTGEKRNYYGRFVPVTTGKLVIDGKEVYNE